MRCPRGDWKPIAWPVTDARMLARMGAAFDLEPQAPCSKEIRILKDLHVARAGLIKDRTRLRNRAQTQDISVLKRQTKTRLTLVERQIAELDTEIATLIDAQQSTARRCVSCAPCRVSVLLRLRRC